MAAQELLTEKQERQSVGVVCLMDLPDDWGKEDDLASYEKTFDRAIQFVREFREENIYFCYGNHDISYVWGKEESGYSTKAEGAALGAMPSAIETYYSGWGQSCK